MKSLPRSGGRWREAPDGETRAPLKDPFAWNVARSAGWGDPSTPQGPVCAEGGARLRMGRPERPSRTRLRGRWREAREGEPRAPLKHPPKRAEVALIAALLSQEPVLRTPEQVGIERAARFASQAQAPVVVLDHPLRGAARHRPPRGTGRRGDGLPRFGLAFADHQPPFIRRRPLAIAPCALRPGVTAGVHVRGAPALSPQRVARIEIDSYNLPPTLGERQRVALVARSPPLLSGDRSRHRKT